MIKKMEFKAWLKENTKYSTNVITDIASRMKRADLMLAWNDEETYLFYLEKCPEYQSLSISVKSQLKRAVRLYGEFQNATRE